MFTKERWRWEVNRFEKEPNLSGRPFAWESMHGWCVLASVSGRITATFTTTTTYAYYTTNNITQILLLMLSWMFGMHVAIWKFWRRGHYSVYDGHGFKRRSVASYGMGEGQSPADGGCWCCMCGFVFVCIVGVCKIRK